VPNCSAVPGVIGNCSCKCSCTCSQKRWILRTKSKLNSFKKAIMNKFLVLSLFLAAYFSIALGSSPAQAFQDEINLCGAIKRRRACRRERFPLDFPVKRGRKRCRWNRRQGCLPRFYDVDEVCDDCQCNNDEDRCNTTTDCIFVNGNCREASDRQEEEAEKSICNVAGSNKQLCKSARECRFRRGTCRYRD